MTSGWNSAQRPRKYAGNARLTRSLLPWRKGMLTIRYVDFPFLKSSIALSNLSQSARVWRPIFSGLRSGGIHQHHWRNPSICSFA